MTTNNSIQCYHVIQYHDSMELPQKYITKSINFIDITNIITKVIFKQFVDHNDF